MNAAKDNAGRHAWTAAVLAELRERMTEIHAAWAAAPAYSEEEARAKFGLAAQRRRREAALRMEPLADGRRDPTRRLT